MKKAIVLAHFGTTHEDTKEKTIDKINVKIEKEFKEFDFFSVYTSRIINRILSKRGLEIENTLQLLERLKKEGYEEIYIQPTFVINGIEMENLKLEVEEYKKEFKKIKISNALLSEYADYKRVIESITKNTNLDENEAIVLVGHGTEHFSIATYPMVEYVAKDLGKNIVVGTVEGFLDVGSVEKKLKERGVSKVTLQPLLFVAGDHAKNDIGVEWKNELAKRGFQVKVNLMGLGEIEEIQKLYYEKLKKLFFNDEDIRKKKIAYSKGDRA